MFFGLLGCSTHTTNPKPEQALFQVSTIDALMQGVYDGNESLSKLAAKGNLGIGTFNALDGEMILDDGVVYQVKPDGKVYQPSGETKTPFAEVVRFEPEDSIQVHDLDFPRLKHLVDSLMGSPNYFYAIRLDGQFDSVHTRSVPAQQRPYKKLVEVSKEQAEFNLQKTNGDLIGFYCPAFTKGINVPGYHVHFLSNDKSAGGHVLGFQLKSGMLKLDRITKFEMLLPESDGFQKGEFKTDRSKELEKVEG